MISRPRAEKGLEAFLQEIACTTETSKNAWNATEKDGVFCGASRPCSKDKGFFVITRSIDSNQYRIYYSRDDGECKTSSLTSLKKALDELLVNDCIYESLGNLVWEY